MNKRLLVVTLMAACGTAALALPAFAQTSAQASPAPAAAKPAASAAQPRAVPQPGTRQCLRDTGSHIPPPKGQCLPVAGSSYDQQDIQRTGQQDIGRALQMLDPSLQIRGGGH